MINISESLLGTGYQKFCFKREAVSYVQGRLQNGLTLCRIILETVNIETCQAAAYLPEYVTADEAKRFDTGGKIQTNKNELQHYTDPQGRQWQTMPIADTSFISAKIVYAFLQSDARHICILEDDSASPHFAYVKTLDSRMLFLDDEVYHVLLPCDSVEQVEKIINKARSWLFIGLLARIPEATNLDYEGKRITHAQLASLVKETRGIIVGAYDGEADLFCDNSRMKRRWVVQRAEKPTRKAPW